MRFDLMTSLALAASLAAPIAATAQYNQGVQPYNPQDPQNYGAPAAQSYGNQYPQQGQPQYAAPQQPQPQPQYGVPQGQSGQQPYPQGAYPDQSAQYPQGGQEQIYQAPPPLPNYDQPPAPGDGYIWTPGYWAFGPGGYYWVPGAWVQAPYDGALWTPGYWDDGSQGYYWNAGYWGPVVGFYGGINYGFGYFGIGFCGGYWNNHRFWYNREYSHVGGGIRNVYSARVNGISSIGPAGRSFSRVSVPRGAEARGGSYNGAYPGAARGFASPGQAGLGHQAYPGSTYSSMNRGFAAPVQRSMAQTAATRTQSFNGGSYGRAAAPSAPHYSAPSAPHYSAPSGGGGHSSGGGSHGGGGHR